MTVDLRVDLNGLTLQNPIIAASGTYGYDDEFSVFCDVNKLGAVVTKAITIEPRPGNEGARIFETCCGMINRIGLENMGITEFISSRTAKNGAAVQIVNIAGSTLDEYVQLAKICDGKVGAIELNLSCPNVAHGCLEFGTDEKALYEVVSAARAEFSGHITAKLTPNVTSIEKIAVAAQKAGANAVSAINTVKGLGIKINPDFTKEIVRGGLSGRAIKPVALGAVERIAQSVDIPVIGMGGIYTLDDVLEFFAVGADAVQIGTANFTHPDICEKLADDLAKFMEDNGFKTLDELKARLR